jgi:hypothetical protein
VTTVVDETCEADEKTTRPVGANESLRPVVAQLQTYLDAFTRPEAGASKRDRRAIDKPHLSCRRERRRGGAECDDDEKKRDAHKGQYAEGPPERRPLGYYWMSLIATALRSASAQPPPCRA